MKVSITLLLLAIFSVAHSEDYEIDLTEAIKKITPKQNFLSLEETSKQLNDIPFKVTFCMEPKDFKIQRYSIIPKLIKVGDFITMKVHGSSLTEMKITNLNVNVDLNDFTIFRDDKPMDPRPLQEGDMYLYSYKAYVPPFVPSGHWNIISKLQKEGGIDVSCMKIEFDVE